MERDASVLKIKNASGYSKKLHKMIVFLSKNKTELNKYLLVKPYKLVCQWGKQHCQSQMIYGIFPGHIPDWSSASQQDWARVRIGEKPGRHEIPIDVDPRSLAVHCDDNNDISGTNSFMIKKKYGHNYLAINNDTLSLEGCIHPSNKQIIAQLIGCIHVLKTLVDQVNTKYQKITNNKAKITSRNKKRLHAIENGKYSWHKMFE